MYAVGTYRYRVNITRTAKDGFRVGDATIEFVETGTIGGERNRQEFREQLRNLIEDGEIVAIQMNHDRAQAHA